MRVRIAILTASLLSALPAPARADEAFKTPVTLDALDPAAFAESAGGAEQPVKNKNGPRHVVWTRTTPPEWDGVSFGDTKTAGARHLRVGFKSPTAIGSVLARGGGTLSVLKAGAAYPGRLEDDADWLPAERLKGGQVSRDEAGREDYATWVLPAGTQTRALRFTHVAAASDPRYAGWLGGVFVLEGRFAAVGPQAIATTDSRGEAAEKINNGSNDGTWGAWDNGKEGRTAAISPENPERVMLTWPRDVTLRGLCVLWAGFGAAEVQMYAGPADRHPREAADADWKSVGTFEKIESQYPRALGVNWMDFGRPVTTRAVRLRITQVAKETHPHINGNTRKGHRVWLGELAALTPLGDADLKTAILPVETQTAHPPIPVRFTLKEPGFVTLVIEDEAGKRVRNLVSETRFPAGDNVAWWDGMDDLGRDTEAAKHGIYRIPPRFVAPGAYRVRGLFRGEIDLRYEFSIYNAGNPAWTTADHTGGWTTNHTPPQAALFVPADKTPNGKPMVYLGSYVSEGGDGLAWVDLDGKKQGGQGHVGGNWTGAPYLARDAGPDAAAVVHAYAGSAWEGDLRLTALTKGGDKPVVKYKFDGGKKAGALSGMAVHNGVMLAALPKQAQLLFIDAKAGKVLGSAPLEDPRGLAFDAQGRLAALTGKRLVRFAFADGGRAAALPAPQVLVAEGLEDPQQIAFGRAGEILVSDHGASHQVKVFAADGKFLRAIGKAGAPKAGPYDQEHMNHPAGLTVDGNGRLWVAENDFQPKRVSVWTLDGKLVNAFYGPGEYGGGGTLDPRDKTRFYYHGMEFRLDWDKGTSKLASVLFRPGPGELRLPDGHASDGQPETPIYLDGKRYFTNCYNCNPTNGAGLAMLWIDRDGIAVPVAAIGRATDWSLLKGEAFKAKWPAGIDLTNKDYWKNQSLFVWCDLNGDGQVQPDEVTMLKGRTGGITVGPDLSLTASLVNHRTMRWSPKRFTDKGAPVYDLAAGETLVEGAQNATSSGGDQALATADGWTILTVAPKPFAPQSMGGAYKGTARWSYPSLWPGLHASHESPAPDRPGELVGTTRLLGGLVTPKAGEAGPLWAINGNMGNAYLFTADGLFVATLFRDERQGKSWAMPVAERGMRLNDLTLSGENFWPSIAQAADGKVYIVDGARTSLVRVDGLEGIRRFPEATVTVTAADLVKARDWLTDVEAKRQAASGRGTLTVALRPAAPMVDGKMDDWASADWADIDKSGVAAWFDSNTRPYNVTAALAVSGDRLYAAFRTGDKDLLRNTGEMANAPFKTGGALDLMIGCDPAADPKRNKPAVGDVRLVVTQVKGKTRAVLYRAVVPGTKEPVGFSSPWRTITLDRVEDVSEQVQLAGADGNFELSVPLTVLGLKPEAGRAIRGDAGILRGNGFQTVHRVYWSNKATGITADVPSEAELTPHLWGTWRFAAP